MGGLRLIDVSRDILSERDGSPRMLNLGPAEILGRNRAEGKQVSDEETLNGRTEGPKWGEWSFGGLSSRYDCKCKELSGCDFPYWENLGALVFVDVTSKMR